METVWFIKLTGGEIELPGHRLPDGAVDFPVKTFGVAIFEELTGLRQRIGDLRCGKIRSPGNNGDIGGPVPVGRRYGSFRHRDGRCSQRRLFLLQPEILKPEINGYTRKQQEYRYPFQMAA